MGNLRGTPRQSQILELAAQGQSDKEVAVALGISVHTVRSHLQRLYRTHGLTNRAEAVASWASQETPAVPPVATDDGFEERLAAAAEIGASAHFPVQTVEALVQLELVNHERESSGLTHLAWDARLADVATLARVVAEREPWRELGDEKLLRRYARERLAPTWAMGQLTDGLLQLFAHRTPAVRELRNRGLTLVNHLPLVKRWLTAKALAS